MIRRIAEHASYLLKWDGERDAEEYQKDEIVFEWLWTVGWRMQRSL